MSERNALHVKTPAWLAVLRHPLRHWEPYVAIASAVVALASFREAHNANRLAQQAAEEQHRLIIHGTASPDGQMMTFTPSGEGFTLGFGLLKFGPSYRSEIVGMLPGEAFIPINTGRIREMILHRIGADLPAKLASTVTNHISVEIMFPYDKNGATGVHRGMYNIWYRSNITPNERPELRLIGMNVCSLEVTAESKRECYGEADAAEDFNPPRPGKTPSGIPPGTAGPPPI